MATRAGRDRADPRALPGRRAAEPRSVRPPRPYCKHDGRSAARSPPGAGKGERQLLSEGGRLRVGGEPTESSISAAARLWRGLRERAAGVDQAGRGRGRTGLGRAGQRLPVWARAAVYPAAQCRWLPGLGAGRGAWGSPTQVAAEAGGREGCLWPPRRAVLHDWGRDQCLVWGTPVALRCVGTGAHL